MSRGADPASGCNTERMTQLLDLYRRAQGRFTDLVHAVGADQWSDPTPCTEWDVRALVNHVTVEQLWAVPLLAGSTIAEVGDRFDGDQLGDDPVAAWDRDATAALATFGAPGALDRVVHLSYGDSPAAAYAEEMLSDLLIHGWDLSRGIGADDTLDAELVQHVYDLTAPRVDELQASGLFAPPVPVPDDADLQTRLLALVGRRA